MIAEAAWEGEGWKVWRRGGAHFAQYCKHRRNMGELGKSWERNTELLREIVKRRGVLNLFSGATEPAGNELFLSAGTEVGIAPSD